MTLIFAFHGLLLIVSDTASAAVDRGVKEYELAFWAKPGAGVDSRVIKLSPRASCNRDVATTRISRMPAIDTDPALLPSQAIELTLQGDVLRRWPMPLYERVEAVEFGRVLLVLSRLPESRAPAILISTQGDIEERFVSREVFGRDSTQCPPMKLDDSSRVQCFEFRDLVTNQRRIIGEIRPCP